jgi:hypothetical protein
MGRCLTLAAVLVTVFFAAAGCGGDGAPPEPSIEFDACQPLTLESDPTITDSQRSGIVAGLQLWNAAAGTRLTLGAAAASSTADGAVPSLPIHFQAAAPPFHGLYEGGQVFVNDDLSGAPQAVVIAHEVGHAFGLVHVPTSTRLSLMNPANLMVSPTAEDIATLAARWGSCP